MKTREKSLYLITMLITLAVSACATTEPPYRGKLSDAMEVASDDYKGERHLEVPESEPETETVNEPQTELVLEPETQPVLEPQTEPLNTEPEVSSSTSVASNSQSDSDESKLNIMLSRGSGRVAGDYGDQHNWLIRMGGEQNDMVPIEVYLGGESVSLNTDSSVHRSVDGDLNILVAGINLKRFFTHRFNTIRPYASAGIGATYMYWSYRNSFSTSDGSTISGDDLSAFTISTAVGIEFKPIPFLSITLEANPKIHLWDVRTGKGFDNDEFEPMTMIVFSVGISLTQ